MAEINLEPQTLDLSLYAGDGVTFRLVVTDKDAAPVNLSGTMIAQIRTSRTSADLPIAEFTVNLADASTGVAVLSLTGEQTQALVTDRKFTGVWDVEWSASGGQSRTLCQGKVECVPDVSR